MSFKLTDIIPDSIKDRYLEDDTVQSATPVAPTRTVHAPPVRSIPSLPTFVIPPPVAVVSSNPLLDDLRKRTSFEATPLGQQLQGFMEALNDTGLPEEQKIRTAMKLGHITPESVVETLNGVQSVLAADKQKFDAQMSAYQATEVDGRTQNIASLESHIADLESQLNAARQQRVSLAAEVTEKSAKIASLRSDYASAYSQRLTEIQQMAAKYQISTGKS